MMQKNDKWAEQFRQRMEGHTEPLPEDLWERLEQELPPAPTARIVPMWKRWTAVAAAAGIVALVSIGTLHYWDRAVPSQVVETGSEIPQPLTSVSASAATSSDIPSGIVAQAAVSSRTSVQQKRSTPSSLPSEATDLSLPSALSLEETPVEDKAETVAAEQQANSPETTAVRHQTSRAARKEQQAQDRRRMDENSRLLEATRTHTKSHWSIGVGAGNTFTDASIAQNGVSTFYIPDGYSDLIQSAPSTSSSGAAMLGNVISQHERTSSTHVRHKQPITVGASVAWQFHRHWTLESGLYYTLLSSDLDISNLSAVSEEQKLHYLGVPLKLQRTLWDNRWLTVYATAGGMIEKCVSAKLTTSHVETHYAAGNPILAGNTERGEKTLTQGSKPWQLSALAAAGLQVNLTPSLSLYAEPGVAYYFDDGSALQTIRKEHPCNFHLQVGLRFTVKK